MYAHTDIQTICSKFFTFAITWYWKCFLCGLEMGWEEVDWIALAQDGYEWRAGVNSVECCCEIRGGLL